MGILSNIKDFGSSIGVLTKLCNDTWVSVDNEENLSLFLGNYIYVVHFPFIDWDLRIFSIFAKR